MNANCQGTFEKASKMPLKRMKQIVQRVQYPLLHHGGKKSFLNLTILLNQKPYITDQSFTLHLGSFCCNHQRHATKRVGQPETRRLDGTEWGS